jgi:hypothetical protein
MIIDNIIHIDEQEFAEVEYQGGNELVVFLVNQRKIILYDISEEEYLHLYKHPSALTIRKLMSSHRYQEF